VYLIGAPRYREVRIHLSSGKIFRIVAENADPQRLNRYIRSAWWNGKPLDTAWFRHGMIREGGTLRLVLGAAPSPWGRALPPPSLSDSPSPLCAEDK
jgi:putative alpha-1,2-mannosidase